MNKTVKRPDPEAEGEPDTKKFKNSIISEHVESADFQELFIKHWHGLNPVKTDRIEIITEPFRICKISNFLTDDNYISEIKDELKNVDRNRKNMDLYRFEQTEDLANVKSESIANLYRTFKSDVTDWMERNTRISLSGKISMSSASYTDTDYLLCHDDNMGDRRIAFIFYLSKDWTPEDGGALDIFDTDENGQPNKIVRSLIPEYNSLVFFEVVDNSYHQVAEITSPDKCRLSINGWFHGPLRDSNKQRRTERICKYFEPEDIEVDLVSQVSKIYLYESIVKNIQETIEKYSFIYLPGFLLPERYEALSVDVKNENIKWEKIGPADLQNYEIASEDTLPETLKEFYNMFKSIHMFHLLKQYTELDLVPETSEMNPKMRIELQRWSRGCYMLINDKQVTQSIKENRGETGSNENGVYHNADSKAAKDPKTHDKAHKKLDESENEQNESKCSKIITSEATESNETIATTLEKELVPEKKVLKNLHKGSKTDVENKSAKGKSKMSSSKTVSSNLSVRESTATVSGGTDSSDIEDYMSDAYSSSESEISESNGEEEDTRPGTLDVLLQFHTNNATEDATIDYIDPSQKDGALIHIPPQDNHLCLVYRTADTCRCNEYVNHYCNDYFYTLVCSYYE